MATDTRGAIKGRLSSLTGGGSIDSETGRRDQTTWDTDGIRSIYPASVVTGTDSDL
jgi:hypothetical protein